MNTHDRINYPRNSLDIEKDSFEKSYITSLRKAVNPLEIPVKEKHIRRIIIGTFQTKSGQIFWTHARALQLEADPIICWKFCHVLHKVLRDGYPKVIPDSHRYRTRLLDLGKMWGLLKQGYGKLIQSYCSLLVNKIDFHLRNPRFPGNLILKNEELDNIGESVDALFQLCCEIYDYMDEILCLQNNVFSSLDMSRSNSMTKVGQCRLAPLIMCIQDSSQLYDFTVKILFKLHSALPHPTLKGHRDRFSSQFKILKTFYYQSNNLQYFKTLIQVPKLPDEPPNFFVQSNLSSHVTPLPIVSQQEETTELEANLLDLTFEDNDSDKADESSIWSYQDDKTVSHEQNIIEEKERIIERLSNRIGELEVELRNTKVEDERKIEELRRSISELECAHAQRMEREVEILKLELEKQKSSQTSDEALKVEEKFHKVKEFYNKFRVEHIELLKQKAESDKQLSMARKTVEELKNDKELLQKHSEEISNKTTQVNSLIETNEQLKNQLSNVQKEYEKSLDDIRELKKRVEIVENELSLTTELVESLKQELEQQELSHQKEIRKNNKVFISALINESLKTSKKLIDEEMELGLLSVNCNPQYFCSQIQILISNFGDFEKSISNESYSIDLFLIAFHYYYQLFYMINCSKTTIKSLASIELSQELSNKCVHLVDMNEELAKSILDEFQNYSEKIEKIRGNLHEIYALTQQIIPDIQNSTKNLDLETLLNNEMEQMDKAIQDAVSKIEQMINMSNEEQSGIKLEVNGKILNACTALMQAIKKLILDAKRLQLEIASKQKGSFSMKEFYQRNHRWTEGLISAAKTVAADANLLVETADKIVSGSGKFEELMAASQEIAASCAQLVVASRVKADSSSQNLSNLSKSSKSVLQETGNIIAITKHCSKLVEENDNDFSKLTLHQAKRLEMECQVKVLELENHLEKERMKLASIRRTHYHLAESLSNDQ